MEASEMRIQNKFSNEMRSQESSFKFRIQNLEEREKSRLDEERTKHELRRDEELKLRDEERANASRLDAKRILREEISNLNREHEKEMRKMLVIQQHQRREIEEQRVAADVRGVAFECGVNLISQILRVSLLHTQELRISFVLHKPISSNVIKTLTPNRYRDELRKL